MKNKYRFTLKKIQEASVDMECDGSETIDETMKKFEAMTEQELGFGEASYYLESVSRDEGKISKIIWKSKHV